VCGGLPGGISKKEGKGTELRGRGDGSALPIFISSEAQQAPLERG
jgi:hypothetical protein